MVWPTSRYTIAYGGINPMPQMFCYLKPYYNDQNKSYFHQFADGGQQMMTAAAINSHSHLPASAATASCHLQCRAFFCLVA